MINRLSTVIFLSSALVTLTACGGGSSSSPAMSVNTDTGLLRAVNNDQEFVDQFRAVYIKPVTENKNLQPVSEANASAGDGGSTGGHSTTYTLEEDVDEFDVLKYDGDYLYIAPTLQSRCCFIAQDAAFAEDSSFAPPSPDQSGGIRILRTDSDKATASPVSNIPLEEGQFVQGLYINGQQLISIGSSGYSGPYGQRWMGVASWMQQNLAINIYDTSNIKQPELQWKIAVEGALVDSRQIGNTLYLISRHTPYFGNDFYYSPANQNQADANAQQLAPIKPQDIIPTLTVNGASRPLFSPKDCLISREDKDRRYAYPVLTSVTAIDLAAPNTAKSMCFNEDSSGIYVSQQALYLSQYRFSDKGADTRIHKFKLSSGKPEYRGSADIDGQLWGPGQADFRISERNDLLRIVTTIFTGDSEDRQDHQLTILRENNNSRSLDKISSLPNSQRPEEIGKANEALYGVRFLDERAYFVTFEQIDPLYVIDLKNPTDPFIAGQLQIPGVSDFLHPVNQDLLLGLGRGGESQRNVKLSLFNIVDINHPQELNSILLGVDGGWSYSEAQYNRHAFTYLASDTRPDRLAVPVQSSYQNPDNTYSSENRLYLLEINAKAMPATASINLIGSILASPAPNDSWYPAQNRSVIDDDAIYFLSGDAIWSALWGSLEAQVGPQ
jgi:uncharacterized secreted protein with C-terminal beta-propeller domain